MAIIKPNNNTISAITALPAAISTGKVLQVVTSTNSTNVNTTGGSFVTTNHSLSITPSSSSNKILLTVSSIGQITTNTMSMDIYRSTSSSFVSGGLSRGLTAIEPANAMLPMPIIHLDSPNTTSAITYTIYFKNNSGGTASYNRADVQSSFTAMEIKG